MKKIFVILLTALMVTAIAIPAMVHAQGQAGTTLSANVTARGYWTKTFTWTIDKSVTPDTWNLFQGDSGTSKYTITVTKDSGTDKYGVNGTVTVNNGGDRATEGLKIVVQVEYKTGSGQFQPLPGASQTIIPSEQIPAGGSRSYDYSIEFTPVTGANYRVAAKVTITNHSGHLGEEWGPEPKADFSIPSTPTMINDVIQVDDTNGYSWTFSSSDSVTYEKTFTCEDEGENTNTATIRETGQYDSATVTVNCYELEVSKTAVTSFTRTYTWTIDKMGDESELTLEIGKTYDVNYEVTVDATYADSDWMVSGEIKVSNPAPISVTINSITDVVSPDIAATVDFGVTFPYTLSAEGILTGTYTASLPNASSRINTVTVTIQNYNYKWDGTKTQTGTKDFAATAYVDFNSATMTEVDESVSVTDTLGGYLGTVSYTQAPNTFKYTGTIGPYSEAGTYWVNNIASFTTCDTETTGSDKWSVKVTVESLLPSTATISGVKFYDANMNGKRETDEAPLKDWSIGLYKWDGSQWVLYDNTLTGAMGDYIFTVSETGKYKIVEFMPSSGTWIQTAPAYGYYEIDVENGGNYMDKDFGNVLLVQGTGGKTLGFWSNKNGQALIDESDVEALNDLNLYKPSGWAYPDFSGTLSTAKTQIKNYLLSANAKDMRWMLSAQLIATVLNVRHGFLSGSTTVYVGISSYVPTGFITIDEIINRANDALSGNDRGEQGYWKNLLDGLNNNWLPFVSPSP